MKRRQILRPRVSALPRPRSLAGDRAVDAGAQMAHDNELAEVARHALRRRGADVQGRRKRPTASSEIQTFAAGEIVPGLQVVDAVQNGTVECGHTASYYYFGKDPTFAFGTSVGFGPQPASEPGLVYAGRRQGKCSTNSTRITIARRCSPAIPAVRWAAGSARKSRPSMIFKGLKMRIGGFPGRVLQKLGAVPAADRGRRYLPGAREGHHRRRRMGRPL